MNLKPTQKVRWPNVTLSSLPRFEKSLDKWFKRKNVRIWITEYGHEAQAGRRAEGRLARRAGRLRGAGARAGAQDPRDGHVHLVRLPRPSDERVAERSPHPYRRCRSRRWRGSEPRPRAWSTRGTRSSTCRGGIASPTVHGPAARVRAGHAGRASASASTSRSSRRAGSSPSGQATAPFGARRDRARSG